MRPDRKTVLVAAHPDDEVIGAGGLLPQLGNVTIVHVTDGAPRDLRDASANGFRTPEEYAAARRRELLAALSLAGVGPGQTRRLGLVDQEASLDLAGLARRLAEVLAACGAEAVLTHPYEGGHPDHDATAFAVHQACAQLARPPELFEFTSYHESGGRMVAGEFLGGSGGVSELLLDDASRARKRRMLDCFRTQRETLRPFGIEVERFRRAPRYDFTQPPAPAVYYDRFPWGMRSSAWLERAREALAGLWA